MAVDHLLHRAAEIDVDQGGPAILVQFRGLAHHLGLAAGKLHRHGKFFRRGTGHAERFARFPHQRLAGDHFRNNEPGAAALYQTAEWKISHP